MSEEYEVGRSLALELGDDGLEFAGHELVVDEEGEPASLGVVADSAGDELLVLLLHRDVVVDQHLHVEPVVALLLEPLQGIGLVALPQPLLHLALNALHKHPRLPHLLQRLLVLAHLAEDCCLVEVGGHDVVLVLVFEVAHEGLLEVDGEADRLEGHHEVAALLEDAGQVVEGQDLELCEGVRVGDVPTRLRQHHHVHCLGDELDVSALLLPDVLHRQPVHLLHELSGLCAHLEAQAHLLPLQHCEGQVDELLLAEDALDRVLLPALPETAHHCPDVEQHLLVAHPAVLDQLRTLTFNRNHHYKERIIS